MGRDAKWNIRAPKYRREAGALDAKGVPQRGWYIWRIHPRDISRTRPDHLRLNGGKFRWEDPPVVNARTGERGHPGMDAHCRCYAEPLTEAE